MARTREGLLGLVGKHRPEGSTLITEDVCFPPERLAHGAKDLQELLDKYGFLPGVAGHAAHGNLHFTLIANFGDPEAKKRYAAFMTELVELVVGKYNGSLKAEHGTGLNMAPFVESEWAPKATGMMWRIKELADPKGILGPNVILTRKPQKLPFGEFEVGPSRSKVLQVLRNALSAGTVSLFVQAAISRRRRGNGSY